MAMNMAELPRKIDEMVNLLRSRDERAISLVDVASVTGVLIATMQAYFTSIDTRIYTEFTELSDYIEQARQDIAALGPDDLNERHIPRAGQELEAIVESTEDATNTIMGAAEEIMSADPGDADAYQELVNDAVMRIFEACSFQDITGQRISKVVETFTYIEGRLSRVAKLIENMDVDASRPPEEETDDERRKRELMLNGPQLKAEAADQAEIDKLLAGEDMAAASVDSESVTGEVSDPHDESEPEDMPSQSATPDSTAEETHAALAASDDSSADEESSQAEIDALFN